MEDLAQLVGERVRAERQARGLSVGALAAAAHVGKGSLSEIENGARNPTMSTLYALAGALGVPLATLIADRPGVRVASPGVEARLLDVSHDGGQTVEVYRLHLDAGVHYRSPAHIPGVVEHLLVISGRARAGWARRTSSVPVRWRSGPATSTTATPHWVRTRWSRC